MKPHHPAHALVPVRIGSHVGYLFHAEGCLQPRQGGVPLAVFVPQDLITNKGLNRQAFALAQWPERNCGANAHTQGSHLWPDINRPLSVREQRKQYVAAFIEQMPWRLR